MARAGLGLILRSAPTDSAIGLISYATPGHLPGVG